MISLMISLILLRGVAFFLWKKAGDALAWVYWRLIAVREQLHAQYLYLKPLPPHLMYSDRYYMPVNRLTLIAMQEKYKKQRSRNE